MKTISTIFLCITYSAVFGQVYSGKTLDKEYFDNFCDLKINNDSSIYFIYYDRFNSNEYYEYKGVVKKINDTLFKLRTKLVFSKGIFEGDEAGILTIVNNDNLKLNNVVLKYQDGYRISYDLYKPPVRSEKIGPIKNGNNSTCYYYRYITLDPKHFHYRDI